MGVPEQMKCSAHEPLRGSQCGSSKLDEKTVIEIRREYAKAKDEIEELTRLYSVKGMAKAYGVAYSTMDKIIRRETWKHV